MRKCAVLLLVLVFLSASCLISIKPIWAASENTWTTKKSMPLAMSVNAAVLNGKIHVIGNSTNYMYDPSKDVWVLKKPMPTPRVSFAIAACGDKVYVIGGLADESTGVNEVYDPATDTWEAKTSMPTSRSHMEATTVNGKIFVIGGYVGMTVSNLNEVYDPISDAWTTKAPVPYPVVKYASAVIDNKIYVIGGQPGQEVSFNQIYDSETDTWSQGAQIPVAVGSAAAGATTGTMAPQRIYVMGGRKGLVEPLSQNYVYDPKTDVWNSGAPLPIPRYGLTVGVVDDVLYAIGGVVGFATYTAVVEQYTPFGYGTIPPVVTVLSPENQTYTGSNVSLAFAVDKPTARISYSLDGLDNVTVTGNTTITELTSGPHNVTVYAKDMYGNTGASETVPFTIAKTEPEPFPTTIVAAVSGASIVIIGLGLLVYFRKRSH